MSSSSNDIVVSTPSTRANTTTSKTMQSIPEQPMAVPSRLPALPPLITQQQSRTSSNSKYYSYTNKRFSAVSNTSAHLGRSRPQSTVFPMFHSSLPYTLVRDFAYATYQPLHYGPPPEPPSAISTPASEFQRRLSDPPPSSWSGTRGQWPTGFGNNEAGSHMGPQLPATYYGDGPPWSEDEDLHSPVVTSSKHRRSRSTMVDFGSYSMNNRRDSAGYRAQRASLTGTNQDGSEYIIFPPGSRHSRHHDWLPDTNASLSRQMPHTYIPRHLNHTSDDDEDSPRDHSPELFNLDTSRFSRDYQFTIASPDEEMHGKAVALFDFARENDNELPLVEGQILWVSYRHGQGWLVAQDPKSGESGLVPEDYVRLVRDIEGGLSSLNDSAAENSPTGDAQTTPTLSNRIGIDIPGPSSGIPSSNQHYTPVVSHFSTSSKDLQPYPPHLLGSPTGTSANVQSSHRYTNSPERRSTSDLVDDTTGISSPIDQQITNRQTDTGARNREVVDGLER